MKRPLRSHIPVQSVNNYVFWLLPILQIIWAVFKEVEKKGLRIDFGKIWKKLLQHTEEWRQNEHKALQEDKSEENGNGYDNKAVNVDWLL